MTRKPFALATALVAAAGAAVPAAALAGSSSSTSKTYTYKVSLAGVQGIDDDHTTVTARAVVRNGQSSVKDWWSRKTVSFVVKKAAKGGYQEPFNSQGYQCTPSVTSRATRFTCRLRGADVATTVRLTFSLRFDDNGGADDHGGDH